MKKLLATAFLAVLAALPLRAEEAVQRQVLSEKPLSGVEGMVVIVALLTLRPGGHIPLHTHPGDEHAVIVTGGDALMSDGRRVSFPDEAALFFPAGAVHGGVTNAGDTDIRIVTTHVVAADQPFSTLAEGQ
jgi:quercetin dioxygenase-like cupin family protein